MRRPKPKPPAAWIKPGAIADFRMVAGEPVTHSARRILSEPWQLGSGDWIVKIEGVSGGVSVEPRFLSPSRSPSPSSPATTPPGRCSVCGSRRIPLDRAGTRFGACSLVPGKDGKGGCPDPLRDCDRERATTPPGGDEP